jgi:hypothetical protein
MSLLRPIHRYHSRADLIWTDGPFNVFGTVVFLCLVMLHELVHLLFAV